MNEISYKLILEDILNSNFENAISQLQKVQSTNDKDYLYLRCNLFFFQKNFYLALDTWTSALLKFPNEIKNDEKFISLLLNILNSLERYDLVKMLKELKERNNLFNKLISWNSAT